MSSSVRDSSDRWPLPASGFVAFGLYAVHAGWHLAEGHPEQLLWACHVGSMAVVIGLWTHSRRINAVGTLILLVGLPLWFINLFTGGRFIITSPLMHLGLPVMGLWGMRCLGLPAKDWFRALLLVTLTVSLCRLATPADQNINLAFRTWGPLELLQAPPQWHLAVVVAQWAVLLSVTELALCRILRKAKWNTASQAALVSDHSSGRLAVAAECR